MVKNLKLVETSAMKICGYADCKRENPQPIFNFNKNSKSPDGKQHYCRACQARTIRENQKSNPEKWAGYARKVRKRDPKKHTEAAKAYRLNNPESVKNTVLKRNFGITIQQYKIMHQTQNGKCAICRRDESEFKKSLSVDHCHKTKKVRALLCHHCNTAIGLLEESTDILKSAMKYLESFS